MTVTIRVGVMTGQLFGETGIVWGTNIVWGTDYSIKSNQKEATMRSFA